MTIFIYLVPFLLLTASVFVNGQSGILCPGGIVSRQPCNSNPLSCSPTNVYYCFQPSGPFLPGYCCPRRTTCPGSPWYLCNVVRPRCAFPTDCRLAGICCDSFCGRKCTIPGVDP